MGHCFSCFHSISGPSVTSPDQEISSNKDEINRIEDRTLVRDKIPSESNEVTLQPLLCNENQRNGNKRNNSAKSFNHLSGSSNNVNAKLDDSTSVTALDKMQRNFINKIQIGDSRSLESKINALFNQYKDPHEDAILSDGIEKLCSDLQLSPDDFQVLVLAWKLNAEQMCCFTKMEFIQGLKSMKVDSIKGLQARLPEIVLDLVKDVDLFKDLYRFTFKFGLDVAAGQRILPVNIAILLWRLVFSICEPPVLCKWLHYLEKHPHIRGIPKDTWYMFLNFSDTVGVDLSNYDDTEAWPSLFDDFVEYQNDQANQNISKTETLTLD